MISELMCQVMDEEIKHAVKNYVRGRCVDK
jgi:hypothetical protein